MIVITGNKISMTRGDTLMVQVAIEREEEPYVPVTGDSIAFFLKHDAMNSKRTEYKDPEPLITKTVPIDTMILELDPEDTKQLEFGKYVYDLQLTFASGVVDTFINNAEFELVPEVG